MKRILLSLFLTLLILSVPSIAFADQTVMLSNGVFEYNVPAGSIIEDTVIVSSTGTELIPRILVYSVDLTYDKNGDPTYNIPNRDTTNIFNSPASWLELYVEDPTKVFQNTPYLELPISGSSTVDFKAEVPQNTPPGDYTAIIFFEMDNKNVTPGGSSTVNARIGAKIVIRVEGDILQKINVSYNDVPFFLINNNLPYKINMSNEGNIDSIIKIKSTLIQGGKTIKELDVEHLSEYRLPAKTQEMIFEKFYTVDGFLIGKYTLVTDYSYYDEKLMMDVSNSISQDIWFIPWWIIIIVVFFLIMLLARLLSFRVKKNKIDKPKKEKAIKKAKSKKEKKSPIEENIKYVQPIYGVTEEIKSEVKVEKKFVEPSSNLVSEVVQTKNVSISSNPSFNEYRQALLEYEKAKQEGLLDSKKKKRK